MQLTFSTISLHASCSPNIIESLPRHFKIRPNFLSYDEDKKEDVVDLRVDFKSSGQISAGIGETFNNLRELTIKGQSSFERSDFANMSQLRTLDLSENGIEFLPDDLFLDLPSLKILYIDYNQIKELPENIFMNMTNLVLLWFSHNEIDQLPVNLFLHNSKITQVWGKNNPFKTINVNFTVLANLSWLELEGENCIGNESNPRNIPDMQKLIETNCRISG